MAKSFISEQNKHKWRTEKRFRKLQNIVTLENTLKDMKYLTKYPHKRILE